MKSNVGGLMLSTMHRIIYRGKPVPKMQHPYLALVVGITCILVLWLGLGKAYVSVAYDPHEVNCLPELHMAFLVHRQPSAVAKGDYLFWKPMGALAYVKEKFVLKRVAGVPGDRLVVKDGKVFINGVIVAKGFDNAILYKKNGPEDFERSETIPADSYFVIGSADGSNDSRYWGYLNKNDVSGSAYRVF